MGEGGAAGCEGCTGGTEEDEERDVNLTVIPGEQRAAQRGKGTQGTGHCIRSPGSPSLRSAGNDNEVYVTTT